MKKFVLAVTVAVGLTGFGLIDSALAEPTCKIATNGSQVTVTVSDTGVVFTGGQKVPQGWTSYPGTGRAGDIAASCSDNEAQCASATWYLRFADSKQGWPGDSVLGTDSRVVKCSYSRLAVTCTYQLTDGMRTGKGQVRMHYSAEVGGQVVAAYQPQSGCTVDKDSIGNHPHTVIKP